MLRDALPVQGPARVCPMRMPEGWNAPYPAWSARHAAGTTEVVMAYFGAQAADDRAWLGTLHRMFAGPGGPARVELGRSTDRAGVPTLLTAAYWTSAAGYDRWRTVSGFEDWWADPRRLLGTHGLFREVLTVPLDRLETLFSTQVPAGIAATAPSLDGPVNEHAYWGGARDRLPISAVNPLASPHGEVLPRLGPQSTRGRRLRVRVPENLAVIHSAQDWSHCVDAELRRYVEEVHPTLVEGMDFLRDHPLEVGCCDMRMVDELDTRGLAVPRSYGFGYFLSLAHLERWAESHPTHLRIFGTFLKMVEAFEGRLDLRLWHEVSVLPGAGQVFEYLNCHEQTGLLPWFAADAVGP